VISAIFHEGTLKAGRYINRILDSFFVNLALTELHPMKDSRLLEKLVPTLSDRGCDGSLRPYSRLSRPACKGKAIELFVFRNWLISGGEIKGGRILGDAFVD
jgi:hypothetical protein